MERMKIEENEPIELELDEPIENHQSSYFLIAMTAALILVVAYYFRGKK